MSLLKNFLLKAAAGVLGFFIADHFLEAVVVEDTEHLFYAGVSLGFLNLFIRPVINLLTLPLRILTLGIFSFFVNIAIVWFVKAIYAPVVIEGLMPLLYTTIIICVLELLTTNFSKK